MNLHISGNIEKQELIVAINKLLTHVENAGADEFTGVSLSFAARKSGKDAIIKTVHDVEPDIFYDSSKQILGLDDKDKDRFKAARKAMNRNDMNTEISVYLPNEPGIKCSSLSIEQAKSTSPGLDFKKPPTWGEKLRHIGEINIQKKQFVEKCVNYVCGIEKIDEMECIKRIRSKSWLSSNYGISKYTNKIVSGKLYRITTNIPGSNNQGVNVYLFNKEGELFESILNTSPARMGKHRIY